MGKLKLTKKDLTKTVFENTIKDFNEVLKLDPPILFGGKATKSDYESEIVDVIRKFLTTDDKIGGKTEAVIAAMGLEIKSPAEDDAVTSDGLKSTIKSLNTVLELDPVIPTDNDEQMVKDILDTVNDKNGLTDGDDIGEFAREVIGALRDQQETSTPDPAADDPPDPAADDPPAAADPPPGKATPDKPKKLNRITAVVDALKNGTDTTPALITESDKIYTSNGGNSNTKESAYSVKKVLSVLSAIGGVTIDGDKIELSKWLVLK